MSRITKSIDRRLVRPAKRNALQFAESLRPRACFKYDTDSYSFRTLDDHIGNQIARRQTFYELELLEAIQALNVQGTYVDVGANIGNHSIYFAKACKSSRVYSFEPNVDVFECLVSNIRKNKAFKVIPLLNAVGEHGGVVSVDAPESNYGMGTCVDWLGDQQGVMQLSIDQLLLENVALIKIDVEGMEHEVIQSAAETISRDAPVIVTECSTEADMLRMADSLAAIRSGYTPSSRYCATPTYIWMPSIES